MIHKLRQRQTECIELQEMIRCDGIHICVMPVTMASGDGQTTSETFLNFDAEELEKLCVDAADIGCDFVITAHGQKALELAARSIGAVRDSGYKKNAAVLSYDDVLSDKEIYEYVPEEDIILWNSVDPDAASTVEQMLDRLTVDGASAIGMEQRIGSIRKGMAADFTVLSKDPYQGSLDAFRDMKIAFTVVSGRIIEL